MTETEVHYLTLTDLAAKLRGRELSPVEVTRAILGRIEQLNPTLHCFATVTPDLAFAQAARAEEEIGRGEIRGPLHGVPIAVKDLCFTKDGPTECGTTILAGWNADYDATVVARLADAGAVLLGKLQMTEGAFAEHHPAIAAPINPWHADHWPGVSSSGSGVATAAGLCYGSLGSDTGGSIRFPSASNGITGLKPTWGRVSRYGIFPLSESLDHIGPMARSAVDAAAILGVIAGADPNDPTALQAPVPNYLAALNGEVRGLKIGVDDGHNSEGVDPAVTDAVNGAVEVLRKLGAEIRAIRFPETRSLVEGWVPFCAVETAVAHEATYPSRAEEYGPTLRNLIEVGRGVDGMSLTKVQFQRQAFTGRLAALFEEVDLLLLPAMYLAGPSNEQMAALGDDPEAIISLLRFTAPFDMSGSPTITMPCGFSAEGVPLGFQLVGRHLAEDVLCRAGHAYQQATDWHQMHPSVG